MHQEHNWVTESSVVLHHLASAALLLPGVALVCGLWHAAGPGFSGGRAGFWLGVLLCGSGLAAALLAGKRSVIVDPRRRVIVLTGRSRLQSHFRVIRFDAIAGASVGSSGKGPGGSRSYHVNLQLRNGDVLALFLAFFEGQYDEAVATQRCQRLLGMVQPAD